MLYVVSQLTPTMRLFMYNKRVHALLSEAREQYVTKGTTHIRLSDYLKTKSNPANGQCQCLKPVSRTGHNNKK